MPFGYVQPITGLLTGTLADGALLSVNFNRDFRGIGNIILVPEPSSIALLLNFITIGVLVVGNKKSTRRVGVKS